MQEVWDQAPLDGKNRVYERYAKGKVSALVCVKAELDTVGVFEPCAAAGFHKPGT
jgi:hypothetical protein